MLAVIRIVLLAVALVLISLYAIIFSLLRPFHRNNVQHAAKLVGKLHKLIGLSVEVRVPYDVSKHEPMVYVCNHQNSYDLFTVASAVQPHTVSIGKKSLKWIPFFGQMYWLTGNILIDRKNTNKAMGTISSAADKIREKKLSVWLFPEGTRSYGRGLLKFKTGAFRTAVQAAVPIVPVCASNTCGVIDLNRWNNGKMIIEYLPPVYLSEEDKSDVRGLTDRVRASMLEKINELSVEAGTELPAKKGDK